jgi:hypothetical protein
MESMRDVQLFGLDTFLFQGSYHSLDGLVLTGNNDILWTVNGSDGDYRIPSR